MGKFSAISDVARSDLLAFGLKNADEIAAITKRIDSLSAIIKNSDNVPQVIKNIDDLEGLRAYARIAAKNPSLLAKGSDEAAAFAAQASKVVKNDSDIMTATGKSAADVFKSKKAADSFLNTAAGKTLLTAGLVAGGIATLMLLTGESDPAKAVGQQVGTAAGAAGAAAGTAAGGAVGAALDTSGAGDLAKDALDTAGDAFKGFGGFFQKWGLLMGLGCFCMIMMVVIMMTLK